MPRTKFSELRREVVERPGAEERLEVQRAETLEEIRLYELRHDRAVSQMQLAGRLEVTQGAISKLEHAGDVRVSTLRQYLDALGARLELVAVFDDEGRRVPVHLGQGDTELSDVVGSFSDRPVKTLANSKAIPVEKSVAASALSQTPSKSRSQGSSKKK